MKPTRHPVFFSLLLLCLQEVPGFAAGHTDALVQPPGLKKPEAGSLAGTLSKWALGTSDVNRGSFSLPLPVEAPGERGSLLAPIFPSYSPEAGIGPFGMGWSTDLSIQRHRLVGELDYQTDGFKSPWGLLHQGQDGFWYVQGLRSTVKLSFQGDQWVAIQPDGSRWVFSERQAGDRGTFAWYLKSVETILGDKTVLQYESRGNALFLSWAFYGGRGPLYPQYQIGLNYEKLTNPFVDYRSGLATVLDQRVHEIHFSTRDARSGEFAERFLVKLGYEKSSIGPAFYLTRLTRQYRSGESDPPVSYQYNTGIEELNGAGFETLPGLDGFLSKYGAAGFRPEVLSLVDVDQDGRVDLEHAQAQQLFQHTDSGWEESALEPLADADRLCRPDESQFNQARALVRMTPDDTDPQVLFTRFRPTSNQTDLTLCTRPGKVLYKGAFPRNWQVGADTKLVDLNRDHRPDFVAHLGGKLWILENLSTEKGGFAFQARDPIPLKPVLFSPATFWVHDLNGDGVADLVFRSSAGLTVWYGLGNFKYSDSGTLLKFFLSDGKRLIPAAETEFVFLDANKDGLTDVMLVDKPRVRLFVNQVDLFRQVIVPAFNQTTIEMSFPIIGDLSGRGNAEVVWALDGKAQAIMFNTASTGLLKSADDGKGTVIHFEFDRAPARPRVIERTCVLSALTVASSGYDPVRFRYGYDGPAMHTKGKFLIGFKKTSKWAPFLQEEAWFRQEDDVSGVLESSKTSDLRLGAYQQITFHQYEDRIYQGIRWLRPLMTQQGVSSPDGSFQHAQTTEYLAYEREVCQTLTRQSSLHGVLTRQLDLTEVGELKQSWHCLHQKERLEATHSHASSLNSEMSQVVERNAKGQVKQVRQLGANDWVLQNVFYDDLNRVDHLEQPGKGTTQITYDPGTGLVVDVTTPDKVKVQGIDRDPVSDALLALTTDRGEGGVLTGSYRFDGQERLWKTWQDFGGSSEASPLQELHYLYPTEMSPGSVVTQAVIDATGGIVKQSQSCVAADGEEITSATRVLDNEKSEIWIFGRLNQVDRNQLQARTYRRDPMSKDSILGLAYGELLEGATPLGQTTKTGFGIPQDAKTTLQTRNNGRLVENHTESTQELTSDGILTSQTVHGENGTPFVSQTLTDSAGLVLWTKDPTGHLTRYAYDALGRIVGITLADGRSHQVAFDDQGRVKGVTREGIGAIRYSYAPTTGLLTEKTYEDRKGTAERKVTFSYDSAGRVFEEKHELIASGESQSFTFEYDGGLEEPVRGQRGFLTRVKGPEYERLSIYNPDGTIQQQVVKLSNWMEVTYDYLYFADGSLKLVRRSIVESKSRRSVETTEKEMVYDRLGRLERMLVNGQDLAKLVYDAEGKLDSVVFPDNQVTKLFYDPTTKIVRGYARATSAFDFGMDWKLNERGLVEQESISFGNDYWDRDYVYDQRGFLKTSRDKEQNASYDYSPAGLIDRISDLKGERELTRSTREIRGGEKLYVLDDLGRVIRKGDLDMEYGPTGQLELAWREGTGRIVQFVYDEAGNRVLKLVNGQPSAAYVDGGYLTEDGLIEPIKVGGLLTGILEKGKFVMLAADLRGTLLADKNGTRDLSSPFGVRQKPLDISSVLDYVERAFDVDLDAVRMGVRDYDPFLGQFLTPDPLLLENIEKCAKSPTECNLYSYASNNPITFVDPTGKFDEFVHGGVTYRLAIAAGMTDKQAAQIALAAACVDHRSDMDPMRVSNWVNGNTKYWHFADQQDALSGLVREISRPEINPTNTGFAVHRLQDVGYEDAAGPHSKAFTAGFGHGGYLTELLGISWVGSAVTDVLHENRTNNTKLLQRVYGLLKSIAVSLNGPSTQGDDIYATFVIQEAMMTSVLGGKEVDKYMNHWFKDTNGKWHLQYSFWVNKQNEGQGLIDPTCKWSTSKMDIDTSLGN